MTTGDLAFLIVFASVLAILIVVNLVHKLFKAFPCLLLPCRKRHLSIDKRVWMVPFGNCPNGWHNLHHDRVCYVTKWICDRQNCKSMGFYCIGEASKGAWTIQSGKIVPDEKEWMRW